jgi:hypothetical protein
MPYQSKAQQRKFHAMESRGEISPATVKHWDKATKNFAALPEHKPDAEKKSGDMLAQLAATAALTTMAKEAGVFSWLGENVVDPTVNAANRAGMAVRNTGRRGANFAGNVATGVGNLAGNVGTLGSAMVGGGAPQFRDISQGMKGYGGDLQAARTNAGQRLGSAAGKELGGGLGAIGTAPKALVGSAMNAGGSALANATADPNRAPAPGAAGVGRDWLQQQVNRLSRPPAGGAANVGRAAAPAGQPLDDGAKAQLVAAAGGTERVAKVNAWVTENVDAAEIEAFNSLVDSGNQTAALALLKGFDARYQAATPREPSLLAGGTPSASDGGLVFADEEEAVAAMAKTDERGRTLYDVDPIYRKKVNMAMARSKVFM